MKPKNHPDSSVNQIPPGEEIGKTLGYVLRGTSSNIQILKGLIGQRFDSIMDEISASPLARRIVFSYMLHKTLSHTDADKMRHFLWTRFGEEEEMNGDADQDESEKCSGDLTGLGQQLRNLFSVGWWGENLDETVSVSIAIIQGMLLFYGYEDEGGQLKNKGDVKTKKKAQPKIQKERKKPRDDNYGETKNIPIVSEDIKSIYLILSIAESYFDAMDFKMDKKQDLNPLAKERETGRWQKMYSLIGELKNISLQTDIIKSIYDDDDGDFIGRLDAVIRIADSYALLQDDEKRETE